MRKNEKNKVTQNLVSYPPLGECLDGLVLSLSSVVSFYSNNEMPMLKEHLKYIRKQAGKALEIMKEQTK